LIEYHRCMELLICMWLTLLLCILDSSSIKWRQTSKTIDLFVPQAAPYATTEAMNKLKDSLRTNAAVIGWNTTSLVPHTYADALKAAEQNKRSVRFIRWWDFRDYFMLIYICNLWYGDFRIITRNKKNILYLLPQRIQCKIRRTE
jgi:hypothetical protein